MAIKNVMVECKVSYDDDIIIFSEVSEDKWGHHGAAYEVVEYPLIVMDDGTPVIHPHMYIENGIVPLYVRRGSGVLSFERACLMADGFVASFHSRIRRDRTRDEEHKEIE